MRPPRALCRALGLAAVLTLGLGPATALAYRGPNSQKQAQLQLDIARALERRDADTLAKWMDGRSITQRAFPGMARGPQHVRAVAPQGAPTFCADLALAALSEAGRYAPSLRSVQFEAGPDAVYLRYLVEDRGMLVSVLQFYVVSKRDGSPTIIDFRESYRGQTCSREIRAQTLAARPSLKRALSPTLQIWAKGLGAVDEIVRLNRAGRHWAAVQAYQRYPVPVQRDYRVGVSLMWNALHLASSQQFRAACDALFAHFGDDPGLLLRAHDYHFVRNGIVGLPRALDILERLDRVVGHDPAIDELRALYMKPLQRPLLEVEKMAQRSLDADPDRTLARIAIFEILANRGDYLSAVKHLDALQAQLPEPRYKALLSQYPALMGSFPYRHWEKFRKAKDGTVALDARKAAAPSPF